MPVVRPPAAKFEKALERGVLKGTAMPPQPSYSASTSGVQVTVDEVSAIECEEKPCARRACTVE